MLDDAVIAEEIELALADAAIAGEQALVLIHFRAYTKPSQPSGHFGPGQRASAADELGRPFKPSKVVIVPALPKTRSAKILRRAVRAAALGEDPGDLSSAENPEALDAIRAALA